ncbi:MAG: TetR/AcrR family transcriptional regulator [Hyphomonadaceae bacterium]|nr:TetR/AcrR family transcriptional regulator [Hyphomonadaceae bacterium]
MAAQVAENLRRVLLDASLALIEAEGLEAFSMREVARRAGVSHQAPYHYFEDREAILAAIVAEGFQELRDRSLGALEGLSEPAKRFTAIGKAYLDFALHNPAHFKLMFRSELVREDKHRDAQACAQGAYDVLVNVADEVAQVSGYEQRTVVVLAWSAVHGLATLMLEGKLTKAVSSGPERVAAAYEAVELLEKLWCDRG